MSIKTMIGLGGMALSVVIFGAGFHVGATSEHALRVADEVQALAQTNEEQRNTIKAMDARYQSIMNELDAATAENTRLERQATAKRKGVSHAINSNQAWRDGAVPVDVADGLRAYSADGGAAGNSAGAGGAGIDVSR